MGLSDLERIFYLQGLPVTGRRNKYAKSQRALEIDCARNI